MQARDIMTRPVVTLRPGTSVRQAAAMLTEKQITAAPVLNDDGEMIGIVSEGDLIIDQFCHDPRSHVRRDQEAVEDELRHAPQTVGETMTTTVVAMSASADAADLADAMLAYDVRSVPIVEGSDVVGIVSRRDLLRTLVRDDDVVRADVAGRIDAYTGGRQEWTVEVHDGRVDLYGEPDDQAEARVLDALARTVAGASSVHLHRTTAALAR